MLCCQSIQLCFYVPDLAVQQLNLFNKEASLPLNRSNAASRNGHRSRSAGFFYLLTCRNVKTMLTSKATDAVPMGLMEPGFGGKLAQEIQLPDTLQVIAQSFQLRRPFDQQSSLYSSYEAGL